LKEKERMGDNLEETKESAEKKMRQLYKQVGQIKKGFQPRIPYCKKPKNYY